MQRLVAGAAALALIAACGASCGSSAAGQPAQVADRVVGATTCPQAEAQDLVFTGKLSGHVTCSTAPAACDYAWVTPRPPGGLEAPISAKLGAQALQLVVVMVGPVSPGTTYVAGNAGEATTHSSDYGVTLDGIGSWVSELGGSVQLSSNDSAGASGTVAVQLILQFGHSTGPEKIGVSGTWRCVKPPGF